MKVLITGSNGFLGKNLRLFLAERKDIQVVCFTRQNTTEELPILLTEIDFIFHLAGVNRPIDPQEFVVGNTQLTQKLCQYIADTAQKTGRKIPILFSSSSQINQDNAYGKSKQDAEKALQNLAKTYGIPIFIFRLPNVFGKWCRPHYNSVIATFCHNILAEIPITIHDAKATLTLVYIDDVVNTFIECMDGNISSEDIWKHQQITPQYTSTVGEIATLLHSFWTSRKTLLTAAVGTGFIRALYATYVSYMQPQEFTYRLQEHTDARGVFVEMLKTPDCGQFSYFTAHPGVTRGGHYHHSKTEKFLVIAGQARFTFRHMFTKEQHELFVVGEIPKIVETIPGWAHDITNIGNSELIVMLWANEIFDKKNPDTYTHHLLP